MAVEIDQLLSFAVKNNASDLHLSSGVPPMIRVDGDIKRINMPELSHKEVHSMVYDIMNDKQRKAYEEFFETDFSFEIPDVARFRVNAFNQARGAGAELLLGGEPVSETVYGTTVLRGAPEDANVIAHEVFGPVVVVQPVEGLGEAIEKVNRSSYPFQSSIFTQDVDRAMHAAREVRANAYMVNDLTAFRVDWMPFGGRKNAGLGLGGTDHGVREMTEEKLVVLNVRPVAE